jgi:hypothetical protein
MLNIFRSYCVTQKKERDILEEYIYRILISISSPIRFIIFELIIVITISERKITKFQVFNTFTIKNFVLWNVTPCSLIETKVSGKHAASLFRVEEGNVLFRNIGIYLVLNYTVLHLKL